MAILTTRRVLSIVAISVTLVSQASWAADVTVTLPAADGFVVEDNTATIERLRVDEATGNISRNGALFVHTTGAFDNLFVGEGAGNTSTGSHRSVPEKSGLTLLSEGNETSRERSSAGGTRRWRCYSACLRTRPAP